MSNFTLSLKESDDVEIIVLKGYVDDLGAERIEAASEQAFRKGVRKLVFNFSGMQFINSIGASILAGIVQKTKDSDGLLCFTNMKKVHRDVFDLLGLTKHVKVFRDEEEAVHFLERRGYGGQ